MAQSLYCWRCDMDVPMLDEQEWAQVAPLLKPTVRGYGQAALQKYKELTGFNETNPEALWHHRLSEYGPPCAHCGKPLRTPKAAHCAACGTPLTPAGRPVP